MKEQNHENVPEYVAADKVMEELRQRDRSVLSALFHGLHRSTIECGTCGHVSLTFEPFSVLSLSFPTNRKCALRVSAGMVWVGGLCVVLWWWYWRCERRAPNLPAGVGASTVLLNGTSSDSLLIPPLLI